MCSGGVVKSSTLIVGPRLRCTLYLTVARRLAELRPVIVVQDAMRVVIAGLVRREDIGWPHCADQPSSRWTRKRRATGSRRP